MPAHAANLRYTESKKYQLGSRVVATKHAARFILYFILYSCVTIFFLTIAGCDDFSFYDLLDIDNSNEPTGELIIIPVSAIVPITRQFTFTAEQGTPPYTFLLTSGSGSIDESSGIFNRTG